MIMPVLEQERPAGVADRRESGENPQKLIPDKPFQIATARF
jgi:hypothetical protein